MTKRADLVPSGHDEADRMSRFGTSARPDARFVTHLLAARMGAAQQRAKRRAAPEGGAAAYRSSADVVEQARRSLDRAL